MIAQIDRALIALPSANSGKFAEIAGEYQQLVASIPGAKNIISPEVLAAINTTTGATATVNSALGAIVAASAKEAYGDQLHASGADSIAKMLGSATSLAEQKQLTFLVQKALILRDKEFNRYMMDPKNSFRMNAARDAFNEAYPDPMAFLSASDKAKVPGTPEWTSANKANKANTGSKTGGTPPPKPVNPKDRPPISSFGS